MDLQFITENFRTFNRTELDGWGEPLNRLLEALFGDFVKPHCDDTLVELMDRARGAVYTVFDLPHYSEDNCEMHVAVIDDKPLGIVFRFGNETDWQSRIIDVELFKSLATELAAAAMEKRLSKVREESLASLGSLKNGFLHFLGKKETMFAVHTPKRLYGFEELLSKCRGYFVDENGQALALQSIGQFVNKAHSKRAGANDITVTIAGQERVVDSVQLMFELVRNAGDVEDALTAYTKEPYWLVEGVNTRHKCATVLLRTPNRWSTASLSVEFDTDEDLKRFADAHFDHEKAQNEQIVHSAFDLQAMGYAARVVSSD